MREHRPSRKRDLHGAHAGELRHSGWDQGDTVVQFTPTGQFQSGKTHVLVISAKDRGGNSLSGPNQVAFSLRATPDTAPPEVSSRATLIDPQTHTGYILLEFSEAMDQQSVQSAFLS